MAIYSEKPYIERVLSEVSGEDKTKLLNFINGKNADGSAAISYTLIDSANGFRNLSSGITPVNYKYSTLIVWSGYFIKTTNYSAFLTFKNGIDLKLGYLYLLTAGEQASLVLIEEVTADNIRTLLREDSYIDPTELPNSIPDATEADAGDALVLDENKNPVWASPSGGTKLYKHEIRQNNTYGWAYITIISTLSTKYIDEVIASGSQKGYDFINAYLGTYGPGTDVPLLLECGGITIADYGYKQLSLTGIIYNTTSSSIGRGTSNFNLSDATENVTEL